MNTLVVPTRRDGTPKAFWYDRVSEHVIHRRWDGECYAFTFDCHHEVRP